MDPEINRPEVVDGQPSASPTTPTKSVPRRRKSVVLDGAVPSTILVVVLALISRSRWLIALFALGWLVYGLYRFIKRFGKVGAAIIVVSIASISTWMFLEIRAGRPKRLLKEQISQLGAYGIHTDGPEWAPDVTFVLFDKRVGDPEVVRFTELPGLTYLRALHFSDSPITDESLEVLSKLKNLDSVSFRNTKVTPEGIAWFRELLPDCDVQAEWPEGAPEEAAAEAASQ